MSVTVQIPTPLRRFAADQAEVRVEGTTVGEALADLVRQHPALRRHLFEEDGSPRTFVNIFLNDEDVRFLDRSGTPVSGPA